MFNNHRRDFIGRLRKKAFCRAIEAFMADDNMGAGIQITGTSGSGKSNIAEWLADRMVRRGIPYFFVDPHGDSARKLLQMSLALPPRLRRKIFYVRSSDPEHTVGINPLSVTGTAASEHIFQSRLRVQVELTAQVIFSLFGEGAVGFGNRTLLRKWLTRWLTTLAQSGLTLADVELLVDPSQPIYQELLRLVPNELARQQMESLTYLKPNDLEAEIGSARNRILAVLDHPVCQAVFSRRDNLLDFRAIYDDDISVIVDLDKRDMLTDDAQQLIGNLILNQYLATVLATPEAKRRPRICFIDELPIFSSSAPLLQTMSTEIRKYRTKFAFLHQGSARFPGRHDNEFLNTITDMCRLRLIFRHAAGDAEFFGRQISLATWEAKKIKHVQRVPQQFTVGHDLVELIDVSEGTSDGTTTGTSNAQATGSQEGTSDQLSETLSEAVNDAQETLSHTSGKSSARGNQRSTSSSKTETTSDSSTSSVSRSRTIKQHLLPRIDTRDIVTSVQFFSPDEVDRDHSSAITQLQTGEAYFLIGGIGTFITQTPLSQDPLSRAPKCAARMLAAFLARQWQSPQFVSPHLVHAERQAFLRNLLSQLQRLQQPGSTKTSLHLGSADSLAPVPSQANSNPPNDPPWRI
jgi:hypothetical protein